MRWSLSRLYLLAVGCASPHTASQKARAMSSARPRAWIVLAVSICVASPAWALADSDDAGAVIAQAKVHLAPALQERIESVEAVYRTPHRPFLPFVPDPCATRPALNCEVGRVAFRLYQDRPAPGICLREFVQIQTERLQDTLSQVNRGDQRIALGADCAAIPTQGYARFSGITAEQAAQLLLWLQAQQASVGSPGHDARLQIDCTQDMASTRPHQGCSDGADAAFARLPLASVTEIGPIQWAPDGTPWHSGQHWAVSVWPVPGQKGWRLSIHGQDDGQDRIAMSWEAPAPF